MQTNLIFNCDKKAKWNTTVTHYHGGASSPNPINLQFDAKSCKVSIQRFSDALQQSFWQIGFCFETCTVFLLKKVPDQDDTHDSATVGGTTTLTRERGENRGK